MGWRECEACGESFHQARGRPAKRCGRCRESDRYGPLHQALRANPGQAVGRPCSRCGGTILEGQAVSPDHVDGGGPHDYRGWAHQRCNVSAGASYGNQLRAAAYRATRGLLSPPPAAIAGNGGAVVTEAQEPLPLRLDPAHYCEEGGCHPVIGGPCACGRHSRAW